MPNTDKVATADVDAESAFADKIPPSIDGTSLAAPSERLEEKALLRKLDINLIPIIMILYLFSFLDRVNIGNAKLYGLEKDLGLTGNQYQVCVSILFVTYCLFEVPSNLIIKKVKPDRYIAFIATSWGITATLTGIVQSYSGLIAVRLALGALEAGLFPGLVTYLTMFYSRNQLAVRVGYLFIASAIAGAMGGIIAYGIGFMDGIQGMGAWRWLMIIEGIPSVLVGISVVFILPTNSSTAPFLTESEKSLILRIRARETGQTASAQKFHWADVRDGFSDWQIWLFSLSSFTNDIMFYGFSTFLPSIIKSLGRWTAPQTQALTVPVYALGTGVYLVVAQLSDRQGQRGIYAAAFAFISVIGYCMLIANKGAAVSYAGTFVVATGLYVTVGLPLAWLPGNKPRYAKRALSSGMQLMFGNMAGIVMPFLYPTKDAPKYRMGYGVSIACVSVSVCFFVFLTVYYKRVNRRRAEGNEDWKIEGMTEEAIQEMGDKSPRYVYQI
ncbi:putative MFS transporter [Bisporella sp. PMI_857]|nr:putative MFS transporter [Bisporella sp. PMI_857]